MYLIYKEQIMIQQGREQQKTPSQHYVQGMTKILYGAENFNFNFNFNFGAHRFNVKAISPNKFTYIDVLR